MPQSNKGIKYGTKYEPKNAPVKKNGGNDAKHDHIVTSGPTTTPQMQGSYKK